MALNRFRLGFGGGGTSNSPTIHPLTAGLPAGSDFASNGQQTVSDYAGVLRTIAPGYPAFTGARLMIQLLLDPTDLSAASWTSLSTGAGSASPVITHNYGTDPDGTQTADRLQLQRGTEAGGYCIRYQSFSATASTVLNQSVWLKTVDGSEKTIIIGNAGEGIFDAVSVDGTWRQFFMSAFNETTTGYAEVSLREASGSSATADLLVWHPSVVDVTGIADQDCPEFVESGAQWFATVQPKTLTVYGDSLSADRLNGLTPWPDLASENVPNATFNNYALSGSTSGAADGILAQHPETYGGVVAIYIGYNDVGAAAGGLASTVLTNIAGMVSRLPANRYVILSVPTGADERDGTQYYTTITGLNNDLATLYPDNYLDLRSYLISQYDPEIPQDVIDFGDDIIPSSLRVDYIHPNAASNTLTAAYVWQFMQTKGWDGDFFVAEDTDIPDATLLGYVSDATAVTVADISMSKVTAARGAIELTVTPEGTGQTGVVWSSYVDADNYTEIAATATTIVINKRVAATTYTATATYSHAAGTAFAVKAAWDNITGLFVKVDSGTAGTHANTANAQLAVDNTCQSGSRNGGSHFAGNYKNLKFYARKPSSWS